MSQSAQSPGGPGGAPAEQAAEEERQERPARGDIPVRRDGRRACKRTALQAALPENQVESLADLDGAILARSSEGPFRSRVRTWVDLTAAWALPAWPISLDSVRKVAASLRRGRYRSAQNYFDAAVTYQEHFRGESVDPLLRRALRRYAKAVVRGLAGSKLKAIFPAMRLEPLLDTSPASAAEPWNPFLVAHAADALLLAVWFMLREIEFAAARTEDIQAGEAWVLLRIPLHKTAQGGGRELTARQLRCACGVRSRPMCPAHAAMRHVSRLKVAGFGAAAGRCSRTRRAPPAGGGGDPHDGGSRGPPRAAVRRPRGEASRGGVAGIQRSADGDHPAAGSLVLDGGGAIRPGSAVGGGPGDPRQGPVGRRRWRGGPDEARRATAGATRASSGPAAAEGGAGHWSRPRRGGVGDDPTAREDLIYNEKGTKVHRPDPAEASTEPFLWRSRCGAWPYGIRRFFRVSEKPAAAAWCARCFPAPAGGDGEGSPTEPVDSPVASSSASESDSSSS